MDFLTSIWAATCLFLCLFAGPLAGMESSTVSGVAVTSPVSEVAGPVPEVVPSVTVSAVVGTDVQLSCPVAGSDNSSAVVWQRQGRALADAKPQSDGRLMVSNVTDADVGLYGCRREHADLPPVYVRLSVQRVPGAMVQVVVRTHTVLASVSWRVNDTGGLPLTAIALRYRAVGDDGDATWRHPLPPHVAPTEHMRELYHLRPNTTYEFQLWAENRLGAGPPTVLRATTRPDPASSTGLARGLLAEAVVLGSESWVIAVCVSLVAVILVSVGGACFVCRNQRSTPPNGDVSESLELVSHLQQPGYELEVIEPDEAGGDRHNNNSQRALLLNNNVEVHPVRI